MAVSRATWYTRYLQIVDFYYQLYKRKCEIVTFHLENMRLFETLALATAVNGHGRLMHPPGRSSLRFFPDDPSIAPFWSNINPNYNDNELYCGGLGVQIQNNYKCGICGDDFMKTRPRDNELSGR